MEANEAEDVVEMVLRIMKDEGKIKDFVHSERNDNYDVKGIDFLIIVDKNQFLAIQVKTSSDASGDNRKLMRHLKKHPEITSTIFVEIDFNRNGFERSLLQIRKEIEGFIKALQSRQ